MNDQAAPIGHSHVFLGTGHEGNERKTWAVIWLCGVMMVAEIVGGSIFGSLALIADGLHMSTHMAAMLIAAMAYTFARRHANDRRFGFGTGKFGDLAGFSSAIILGMVALLIAYEAVERLFAPVPINFNQAIPIAVLGLCVNIASAWLLSGGDHGHGHSHGHAHGHDHGHDHGQHHHHAVRRLDTGHGVLLLEIHEDHAPARFRLRFQGSRLWEPGETVRLEVDRPDGTRQRFPLVNRGEYLESCDEVGEPHEFTVRIRLPHEAHVHDHTVTFSEHGAEAADDDAHARAHRDNNMRAAFVHVVADAGVSVLAILGLSAGKFLGWNFMDPVMGIVGALVIANWAYTLVRDTGGILLDMTPDPTLADKLRAAVEQEGDQLADLHLWRLGPGHLGAIVSIVSDRPQAAEFYRCRLGRFDMLSHVTIEVRPT